MGLGWVEVGWDNNVQGHLRTTHVVLRCWTLTCTWTQKRCYAEDVLRYDMGLGSDGDWVGWGKNVQGHLHRRDAILLDVHLHMHTDVMDR